MSWLLSAAPTGAQQVYHPATADVQPWRTAMAEDLVVTAPCLFQRVGEHGQPPGVEFPARQEPQFVRRLRQRPDRRRQPVPIRGDRAERVPEEAAQQVPLLSFAWAARACG